jgi:hypothetical protein
MTDNKFQRGKIYSLRSISRPDLIYIGSTVSTLTKRLCQHKCSAKRFNEGKGTKECSYDVACLPDCYVELIENYPCTDKNELLRREGQIMRATDCINKRVAGRDKKQYYKDNAIRLKQKNKRYRTDNAEYIKQYGIQYRAINKDQIKQKDNQKHNCPCGGRYTQSNKSQHFKTLMHKKYMENQ